MKDKRDDTHHLKLARFRDEINEKLINSTQQYKIIKENTDHHPSSTSSSSEQSSPSLVMTTIFTDGYTILPNDLKRIQQVEILAKWRRVFHGENCQVMIWIGSMSPFETVDLERMRNALASLDLSRIGVDIGNVYSMNENASYLKSLGDYTFKRMLEKELIKKITTCDVGVGFHVSNIRNSLMVKLFFRKPYSIESLKIFENDNRLIYIMANVESCDLEKQKSRKGSIFSCKFVHVNTFESKFGIYETNEDNELIICKKDDINILSYQGKTKIRGEYKCLGELNGTELLGQKVSCSIIPNELLIVNTEVRSRVPYYAEDHVVRTNKSSLPIQSLYSHINGELIGNVNNDLTIVNNQSKVIIQLDVTIYCKLLQCKLLERRIENCYISSIIDSVFIKRGLGFLYSYYNTSNGVVQFEKLWCLDLKKRKWRDEISENIKIQGYTNELVRNDLRDVILSRSQEFEPLPHAYNYLISSTFLLCLQYFKKNNIGSEELNDQVWDYLLNNDNTTMNNRLGVLKSRIHNQKTAIYVVKSPVLGARSVFFSSFLKKIPQLIEYRLEFVSRRLKFLETFKSLYDNSLSSNPIFTDTISMTIQCSKFKDLHDRYNMFEAIVISIFKQSERIVNHVSPTAYLQETLLDKHLIMQSVKALTLSKRKYNQGKLIEIIGSMKLILKLSIHIERFKKKLNQVTTDLFKKHFEIIAIFMYPVIPNICIYLWVDVLKRKDEIALSDAIPHYDEEETERVYKKFIFCMRVAKRLKQKLKGSKIVQRIVKVTIPESKSSNFESCLMENKELIIGKFKNRILDMKVECSSELFGCTFNVDLL